MLTFSVTPESIVKLVRFEFTVIVVEQSELRSKGSVTDGQVVAEALGTNKKGARRIAEETTAFKENNFIELIVA